MCRSILRRSRAGQSQRAALQLSPTPPATSRKCMERAPILRAVSAVNVHTLSLVPKLKTQPTPLQTTRKNALSPEKMHTIPIITTF